jgi:hypothetical protein
MDRLGALALAIGLGLAGAAEAASVTFTGTVPYDTTRHRAEPEAPHPINANSSISRIGRGGAAIWLTVVAAVPSGRATGVSRDALAHEIAANGLLTEALARFGVNPVEVVAVSIEDAGNVVVWIDR